MKYVTRLLLFVILAISTTGIAAAQEIEVKSSTMDFSPQIGKAGQALPRIHITDDLLRSPEGRQALQNYVDARESGLVSPGKGAAVADTIGQERNFNVQTGLLDQENKEWVAIGFTLRATNEVANVWVETSIDGTFSDDRMEELEAFILDATPEDSFQPSNGIIENDNTIFGMPPNFDGDGAVDILLYDIDEGEEQGCCVLGYVTSTDINPLAREGEGNKADVLHVDLPDGLRNGGVTSIAGTIAHEYQHLIHLAYVDSPELTFVNEGLSEWAEVMNGFFLRTINYLQDTAEHNTPLLEFRDTAPVEVRENDYQRSGLFTTYLADRIGWEATGGIVQATRPNSTVYATGAEGYGVTLQTDGLTLEDVVADFHTANVVNDRSADPRFGYSLPQRQNFVVTPTSSIDGSVQNSASTSAIARSGAVHYIRWTGVADLALDISANLSDEGDPRDRTKFHVFAKPLDGPGEVTELESTVTEHSLSGEYQEVVLVMSNVNVSADIPVSFTVASEWTTGAGSFVEETVSYDDGDLSGTVFYGMPEETMQATRFDVAAGAVLQQVFVAPVWDNQLQSAQLPSGLPRDFTLYVWEDDGSGLPGNELFSLEVVEDPTTSHVTEEGLVFLAIDLSNEDALQSALSETVYVGIGNAGTDENYLSLATSLASETGDLSFLYYPFQGGAGWAPYSSIQDENEEPILEGTVLPVRAKFLVPTADEDEVELPSEVKLEQNYPNPFNPTTSIEYSLPRSSHVRLVVYNVLGKEVATIVEGVQSAGEHTSHVDAAAWSSGVYFYTLETEGRSVTRQMIVLK